MPSPFYWSLLHAPGFSRHRGELPFGLLDDFAAVVPVPVESLQAVATPLPGDRLLVCAAPKSLLQSLDPSTERFAPRELPELIPADDAASVDLADLNLLVGEFEPKAARRTYARKHLLAAAAALLASALLTIGLARRASHSAQLADDTNAAIATFTRTHAPQGLAVLDQELARLRLAAQSAGVLSPSADAAVRLAELLNAWPASAPSKPQSLVVNTNSVAVSVSVEGDPTNFLNAFRAPAGWTMDEPRLNTAGSITRLSLQLKPPAPSASAVTVPSPTIALTHSASGGKP